MITSILDRGKIRVGVLRGGPSSEYDISLRSGANVLNHLPERYAPIDILVTKDGEWHVGGVARTPDKIFPHVDVVWNGLHGKYGEDGKVQKMLETFGVPFTGSGSFASAMGMNKNFSKALFGYHNFKTPIHTVVYSHDNTYSALIEIFQSIPHPSVIKPISGGSSISTFIARDFDMFKAGIEEVLKQNIAAVVEEYIDGVEVSCGVIEGSDGQGLYALFPTCPSNENSTNSNVCPAPISNEQKKFIQKLAIDVHKHFNLKHYSSVDAIIHPTRGVFLLEVDTLPVLLHNSIFPTALRTADITIEDFIDHVLTLALTK